MRIVDGFDRRAGNPERTPRTLPERPAWARFPLHSGTRGSRSIGQISKLQSIADNNEDFVDPAGILGELIADDKKTAAVMRKARKVCDDHDDVASASLLENFIGATERRTWLLFEAARNADGSGY